MPKTLLKVLEATDAFRKPERFGQLLLACEADSRGRLGFEERAYPQVAFYHELLAACQAIDVQAIIQAGFTGVQIKEELHKQRRSAVRVARARFKAQLRAVS